MKNTIAIFQISTEEDLRFHLEFIGLDLTGRSLEMSIREMSTATVRMTVGIGSGLTLSGSTGVQLHLLKATVSSWARTEYTADLIDATGGGYTRLMAVRFIYSEPGKLVYGVKGNRATIAFGPNQAVVTAVGGVGPPGPANTLSIGSVTTLDDAEPATATLTGAAPNQTLNLGLPRGDKGDTGDPGEATPEFITMVEQVAEARVQTGNDAEATSADRVQTDIDRGAADLSAENSANSATLAQDWATKMPGTVSGGEYSAKKYAADAKTEADRAAAYVPSVVFGQISGLMPANDVTNPNTHLVFPPGKARDKANDIDLVLVSALTKRVDQVWAAGTGNGCLDVIGAYAAFATLFFFIIRNPTTSAVDILASNSPSAPTLPSGFTQYRRITATVLDASSNLYPAIWKPTGEVMLKTPIELLSALALGNPSLQYMFGPMGIKFKPIANITLYETGSNALFYLMFRDPELGPPTTFAANGTLFAGMARVLKPNTVTSSTIIDDVYTDTMAQVYIGAGPTTGSPQVYSGWALGWWDPRDEYA